MFNFFKKKPKFTDQDIFFLKEVIKSLPETYHHLLAQISHEFIWEKRVNELGDKGTFVFVMNGSLEDKFIIKTQPIFYILQGISMWDSVNNKFEPVELHITQGMICGFKIDADINQLDFNQIDVSDFNEKHFNNQDVEELKLILNDLPDELKKAIEIEGSFKIEISEGVYFTIKNLGDGNYLSINHSKEVFLMVHDPYQVQMIDSDLTAFIKNMRTMDFDVADFLPNP